MKKIMNQMMRLMMGSILMVSVFLAGTAGASDMKGMENQNMPESSMSKSDKFGDLIHESIVDGYSMSYYFMDLRNQKTSDHGNTDMNMEKPHHIMVYIADSNKNPISKGKVGFLIKGENNNNQKGMGMLMSNGFGTTADMKKKGVYTIVTKAMLGETKLMDSFEYTIN